MYNPSPLASDATSSFRRCIQAGRLRWLPWEAACDSLKYKKIYEKNKHFKFKRKNMHYKLLSPLPWAKNGPQTFRNL